MNFEFGRAMQTADPADIAEMVVAMATGLDASNLVVYLVDFEQQVLEGARKILTEERQRPRAILVEVHPFAWADAGTSSASFLSLLDEMGFRVEDMEGAPVSSITEYGHVIALRK